MSLGAFKLNAISRAMGSAYSTLRASGGSEYYLKETSTGKYYKIYRFTTTGTSTLTVTSGGTADVLLVGGGGGRGGYGGTTPIGMGGGGGGGVLLSTGVNVSSGSQSITVGAGGAAGGTATSASKGSPGGDTTAFGLTAYGGGYGGAWTFSLGAENPGGTAPGTGDGRGGGGGGGTYGTINTTVSGGTGKYNGGSGFTETTNTWSLGGGGGGAGGNGGNAAGTTAGSGGAGVAHTFHINSTNYYGCGGNGYRSSGGGNNGAAATGYPYFGSGGGASSASAQAGCVFVRNEVDPTKLGFSFFTSTTSTTSTIVIPSGGIIQNGDVAFLVDVSSSTNSTLPTSVTPSGWTSRFSTSNTNALGSTHINISTKKLATSDGGTTVTGMLSGGNYVSKALLIYRPTNPSTHGFFKFYYDPGTSSFSTGVPTSLSINMSGVSGPFIGFALATNDLNSNTLSVSGPTRTRQITAGSNRTVINTYEQTSATTSSFGNGTISKTDGGNINGLVSLIFKWYDE